MSDVILTPSEKEPPCFACGFGFEVEFRRDTGRAARVFAAMGDPPLELPFDSDLRSP